MAATQNIFNLLSENDAKGLFDVAIARASESMQNPNADNIGHYPMFWMYTAVTGKTWEQIRTDAGERFRRSLTTREIDNFLAVADTSTVYRRILEYFSMFLFCKWKKEGSVRRHKWTALELALTCPENEKAFKVADFQERIDDEVSYLDFDA